jgi:hypothetical protein
VSTSTVDYCEAFVAVMELAQALGVSNINRLDGCWTHRVDDQWWVAVNGHSTEQPAVSPDGASGHVPVNVPPYGCYVEFNGWGAGFFDPFGGTFAAGSAANEDTFIEAVKRARGAAS